MTEIKEETIKQYSRKGNHLINMVSEKKKTKENDKGSFFSSTSSKIKKVKKVKPFEFEKGYYHQKSDLIAKFEEESNFL